MQRGSVILSAKTSPHAARKSEWLRSALAHHHCPGVGVENEIVVLATGIDQYIQEVFHHLAYPNRDDVVSAEDFEVLCSVLGLTGEKQKTEESDNEDEEIGVVSGLSCEIGFKDFHSRLCGFFRLKAARNGTTEKAERLPISEETELVEREIRLRWPRVRRKKSVSFNLARGEKSFPPLSQTDQGYSPARDPETGPRVEPETAALRELVEDLRSALQGSDARCLALEVALRRERGRGPPGDDRPRGTPSHAVAGPRTSTQQAEDPKGTGPPRGCGVGGEGPAARGAGARPAARDLLLRELKLIRSSRDGQLEEAIRFNQRLEEELRWAYQETQKLEAAESQLRKENASIRRRAEDAREALRHGLQKVRLIQEQARHVPGLRRRVAQLESQLREQRSQRPCGDAPHLDDPVTRKEVGFQRAVEGRAASDEDEEDGGRKEETGRDEGQCCRVDERRLGCARGCQTSAGHQLLRSQSPPQRSALREARVREHTEHSCMEEMGVTLKETYEEVEGLRLEVQLMETERLRLSLLEEKLTRALSLLHRLRTKNVSCRSLGKILMDALDTCSHRGLGPAAVLRVADALCALLSSNELLREQGRGGGAEEGGEIRRGETRGAPNPRGAGANPLLISC